MVTGIKIPRLICGALFFFAVMLAMSARAASLQVAPTTIEIGSNAKAGLLYVTNNGDKPMMAQIEAFDWAQTDAGDQLAPSASLVLSPPMVRLAAGEKQTVRLAVKPGTARDKERAYRLVVSEIPELTQAKQHDVQMVLQFSVPVFAEGTGKTEGALLWQTTTNAGAMVISAHNIGGKRMKLTKISLVDSARTEVESVSDSLNYILAGSTKQWMIALPSSVNSQGLTIQTYDETGGVIISAPLLAMR